MFGNYSCENKLLKIINAQSEVTDYVAEQILYIQIYEKIFKLKNIFKNFHHPMHSTTK